jgi:lysophospholipase
MTAIVDADGPKLCILPSNPAPEGMKAGYFTTPDKVRIRYATFPKTEGAAKGTV